ncbi:hypothetical protein ES703_63835 [subsurface metagenome]
MDDVRFCFDVYDDFEQDEDGDTLIHTFSLVDWPICVTKWLYLWGSRAGVVCVSTSVPLHFHRTAPLFPPRGVIDSLEFDTECYSSLDIIHIAANVYLIAYCGPDHDGFLKTVSIESNGQIGAVIHWMEYEPNLCFSNALAHIPDTDKYIVGFQGPGNDGYLRTFSVSEGGVFGPVIDSWEVDPTYGRDFRFLHLGGTVWLLAYQGSGSAGYLKTKHINLDGTFGATISTKRFQSILGAFPALVHISGNMYGIAYTGRDFDGWLQTWEVSPGGIIAAAFKDSREFDTEYCHYPQMRHIAGNIYAIAYQGQPNNVAPHEGYGWIKTITIADDGTIFGIIDIFQFTHNLMATMVTAIIPAGNETYIIAYTANDDHGQVVKVTIHDDGQIEEPLVDEFEFDDTRGWIPEMIPVSEPVFVIAYSGVDEHGWLKTVSI